MKERLKNCTCKGDRWPDGSLIVTVGCRIHHLMDDGAPAADHEILCMCGNFADDRKCATYLDGEDGGSPYFVCPECVPWAEKAPHLTADPVSVGLTEEDHDRG